MKPHLRLLHLLITTALMVLAACGGGGSNSGDNGPTPQPISPPTLTITTGSLPQGVQGAPYSATLTAQNGTAPYKWSVDPNTQNPLPPGVSLDAATGVLSGIPTASGYFNVSFAVADSSTPEKTTWGSIPLQVASPLAIQMYQTSLSMTEYQSLSIPLFNVSGGIPPYTYSVTQGSLPPGSGLSPLFGYLTGAPAATGTYTATMTVTDSYSPADHQNAQPITIIVSSYPLQITSALNGVKLLLNKPFSGNFVAVGGSPPYTFSITSGSLPPGLSLTDPSTGLVTGTPTTTGTYNLFLQVTDSQAQTQSYFNTLTVTAALGRNDTPAKAVPIGNSGAFGSISPALDSTGTLAPDTDYYKLIAQAGSTIHVETFAKRSNSNNPLDTVIEVTDVNGGRFSTGCNQPGGSTTDFTSPCLNDDISASPHVQDSALDYKVPGTSGTQSFLVHVLDWSGNARPDMQYTLQISGAIDPLVFSFAGPGSFYCIVSTSCNLTIMVNGGAPPITYSVSSGTLPSGIAFSGNTLSGTPTSTGTYNFTITATDTAKQTASQQESITVVGKLALVTSSLPSATVNIANTVQLQATGGQPPYSWSISGMLPASLLASVDSTGKLTYVATQAGTYSIPVAVYDNVTYQNASANLPVTITP